MEEVWKDIEDYPNYQVSNFGQVKNKLTCKTLRPGLGGVGYLTVSLYKNHKAITKNVHELVANAFLGKRPDGMTINHKDGNKVNNKLSNLEIVSYSKNLKHAYESGLNKHLRPVRIVETSEVFASIKECADAINGDCADISMCLNGKLKSHKGLHFELDNGYREKTPKKPFLYPHQQDAVERMFDGCILNGGVGSGKSRTGLYYYFKEYGGSKDADYVDMTNPSDLYIITTAKKRNDKEWEGEMVPFLLTTNPEVAYYKNKVVVDSWQNIKKYINVTNAFFIFDEDHVTGNGAWVKAFLKIARSNRWIILSATSGDRWEDYIPVFVANGFYRNITEFRREHFVYARYSQYPKVERILNEGRLIRLRNKILIDMDFKRITVPHHEDVYVRYDVSKYKDAMRNRWDPYKNEPIQQASGLCYVLRRIVNTDESRQRTLLELFEDHPKMIVFYNFDHERDILLNLHYGDNVEIAEYSGHAHQPIPDGDKWVYLVNYNAGAEGFNCIKTDTIVFYSQNYSYKTMIQAAGRIDRLNTPFTDLYYYHLKSRSGIDLAISKALANKRKFNETKFVKW